MEATLWEPQQPDTSCEPSDTRTCAILYLLTDLFDDEHLIRTRPHFERAGYTTFVASNTLKEIRGFHECYNHTPARPDLLLGDVHVADYDAILFAGSDAGATIFHNDPMVHQIAREAMEQGIVIAAVGDGPVILAKAGLLNGKTVTVVQNVPVNGIDDQWFHAIEAGGAIYTDQSPVRDGLLVTADFASATFTWGIIEVIEEE
jgi:protease I